MAGRREREIDKRQSVPQQRRMARPLLDERDICILSVLSREGRISKVELARRVNLSATPCWERLKRLEDAGLIRGYRADIALSELGPSVIVFVLVELGSHRAGVFQLFERAALARPEVFACWSIGGGYDYLLQVITRDIDSYQSLMDGLLEAGLGIARYYSYIVTKEVKAPAGAPIESILVAGERK